eukprot:CAMPEP_0206326114 /NCGR_PEP_ID=MMETSP0106_2-20121207/21439_2 /ASSEMBLY_ACC=CAM_ASM_000206 /TAXON_ID=81532 /ORGANISM="Acanthoeca-like sp., Strain 10tr" /LENGTH=105 /DNA_ID=CAMNT_0053758637 /DNA_START=207 /DNA_END=523 /DNA_ORIENTATION=-
MSAGSGHTRWGVAPRAVMADISEGVSAKDGGGQVCEQPPAVGGPRHGGDPPLQVPLQHHRARGHLVALGGRNRRYHWVAQQPKLGRRQWTIGHHLHAVLLLAHVT